ncbi:hypothetical protein BDV26DRAFT_257935 [Aspergillus bertholletiae]|uniref:DUF4440 domain-containing protein n=1 Tax=Aspergillus bertholletiae TaxID=1226010 RepID=A0A5N7BEM3_9EURO|nr:hypothetical protein BDV26DRAFT_257935 [Aspergillus bertholletiae]
MDPTAKILAREQEAWEALCVSGSALLPMLAKESIMLFPGGMMLTNVSTPTLESTLTGGAFTPWKKYSIQDSHVRLLDRHGASGVICYRVTAERETGHGGHGGVTGETVVFNALCSSTWRKMEDGEWKMVSHQQTPC